MLCREIAGDGLCHLTGRGPLRTTQQSHLETDTLHRRTILDRLTSMSQHRVEDTGLTVINGKD